MIKNFSDWLGVLKKQTRVMTNQHIFKSGLIEKGVCDNANVIHAWNRFKTSLGKENWYRNHLSLPKIYMEFSDL